MDEREEFEKWYEADTTCLIDNTFTFGYMAWEACAKIKDKRIEELTNALRKMPKIVNADGSFDESYAIIEEVLAKQSPAEKLMKSKQEERRNVR